MKTRALLLLLGVFLARPSLAWVSANSGNDTIRIVSHIGDVTIEDEFVKTTVSLTFANRGQEKEGAIYQFTTDYGASATNLEIKIGKNWQKGVLLESNQAREAYTAITGLDSTPRNIDPGLLVKDAAGSFTLHVYPIPAGGTLEARFTLVSRAIFDGAQFYYSYPDGGDETTATPKLNIFVTPPTNRTIASAMYIETEAKLIATGKGTTSQIQPKAMAGYGGPAMISWKLKPPSTAVPAPVVDMYTAPGIKNDSFMYLRFSLDPITPAQEEMKDYPAYAMLAMIYDTALPEGSLCTTNNPYYFDPGTSYWMTCWLPGAAPKSAQAFFTKNGVSLDKPISATAKTLEATVLSGVFLAEIEDNYYFDQLLSQTERNSYSEDNTPKSMGRFFTIADRYGIVTTMTSLLAIDPSDEFSRDVVAFAKKWGARYATQMLGGVNVGDLGMASGGSYGASPRAMDDKPMKSPSADTLSAQPEFGTKSSGRFYDPFEQDGPKDPAKTPVKEPVKTPVSEPTKEPAKEPAKDPNAGALALTAAAPSKVLHGETADRDQIISVLKTATVTDACLNLKSLTPDKDPAFTLKIENGALIDLVFYNLTDSTACSAAIRAVAFPKVSVEFVALLSALQQAK
jgi:hypothetical protein